MHTSWGLSYSQTHFGFPNRTALSNRMGQKSNCFVTKSRITGPYVIIIIWKCFLIFTVISLHPVGVYSSKSLKCKSKEEPSWNKKGNVQKHLFVPFDICKKKWSLTCHVYPIYFQVLTVFHLHISVFLKSLPFLHFHLSPESSPLGSLVNQYRYCPDRSLFFLCNSFSILQLKWSFKIINIPVIMLLPCSGLPWLPTAQMKLQISHKPSRSRLSQPACLICPQSPPCLRAALCSGPLPLARLLVFPYAVSTSWHSSLWIFPLIFQGLSKCPRKNFLISKLG